MSREREKAVGERAASQHGVVTRAQLLQAGLSPSAIDRRLASGRYRALHSGVYLVLPFPLPLTREMAAVLASGYKAVLSHRDAAHLWGMGAAYQGDVDVIVQRNSGHRRGIRAHRMHLPAAERTVRERIPVTTPERTLLDLASVLDAGELEAVFARAEREGIVRSKVVGQLLKRDRRHPGTRAIRALLRLPGGPALTRSAAEAELLALVREAGLPPPQCNVRLGRYEVDLLWRAARIAVEVDGFRYHSSRQNFEGDRRKDAELVAAGLTVLRLSWRQVTDERVATAVKLGQALARAGSRR